MADFEDHTSDWIEPVSTSYRGYDIWEVPPNSSGILALMILNIMEGYDIRVARPQQRRGAFTFTRKRRSWSGRTANSYVADADANELPTRQLISKPYAEARPQTD